MRQTLADVLGPDFQYELKQENERMAVNDVLIDSREAAGILKCSTEHIRVLAKQGKLASEVLGTEGSGKRIVRRFKLGDVRAFEKAQREAEKLAAATLQTTLKTPGKRDQSAQVMGQLLSLGRSVKHMQGTLDAILDHLTKNGRA